MLIAALLFAIAVVGLYLGSAVFTKNFQMRITSYIGAGAFMILSLVWIAQVVLR